MLRTNSEPTLFLEGVDQQDFTELYHNPTFNVEDFNRVDDKMKSSLPLYIKTYVSLNKFTSQ